MSNRPITRMQFLKDQLKRQSETNLALRAANHDLENKLDTSVQHAEQLDNVRQTLIDRLHELRYGKDGYGYDGELGALQEENAFLQGELEWYQINENTVHSVLENSGAFDDSHGEPEWQKLANDRMKEIFRKEAVIRHKDEKATRLINIIREKNSEIDNLKWKLVESQRKELRVGNDFINIWNELTFLKTHFGLMPPPNVQPVGQPGGQPGY